MTTFYPSRRRVLQAGLAFGAATALPHRSLFAAGANEQINVGLVGCGGRGGYLAGQFAAIGGVKIVGLCDPDKDRVGQLGKKHSGAKQYADVREMLDSPDVDVAVIATCNHWHGLSAIWAMEAGKDVYVEKPLCTTQWEGQQVVNAAKHYNKVCQIGTQQRSDPMQAEIKKVLHEDKLLGDVRWVQVNRFGVRASIGKRETPLKPPASVDYNLWLGPAQDKPIFRDQLHYDWHWVWNTGSGEMGNWGVHIVDDVRNNVFLDKVDTPARVVSAGGRFVWHDAGNTPNLQFAVLDIGGIPVTIGVCNISAKPGSKKSPKVDGPGSGYVVHCEGGRLEGQRGRADIFDAAGEKVNTFKGDAGETHQQNFVDAVRASDPSILNGPVEQGHYSTDWCNLANVAERVSHDAGSDATSHTSIDKCAAAFDAPEIGKVYQQLADVCKAHGNDPSRDFQLSPILSLDTSTGQFNGANAKRANPYLRRKYRDGFVVEEVKTKKLAGV